VLGPVFSQRQFIHQIQLTRYRILALPEHNSLTANIIHPATQKHLDKYLASPAHLVCETPQLYQAVTLPALQGSVLFADFYAHYKFLD
jgi:hypothetical protein